jgi:predicted RNA polymerase sigma factor
LVERLAADGELRGSHLLPSVRGELLVQLGRTEEARAELLTAAELATNERQAAVLRSKAAGIRTR